MCVCNCQCHGELPATVCAWGVAFDWQVALLFHSSWPQQWAAALATAGATKAAGWLVGGRRQVLRVWPPYCIIYGQQPAHTWAPAGAAHGTTPQPPLRPHARLINQPVQYSAAMG